MNLQFQQKMDVDLSSPERQEIPIEIEWAIKVPEPEGLIKKFFFSKFGKIEKDVNVSIENVTVDRRLRLNGGEDELVYLRSQGERGQKLHFKIKELNTFCRIIFNPAAIIDCSEQEKAFSRRDTFPVKFDVILRDDSHNEIERHNIIVNVDLKSVHLAPTVSLTLDEDITYSSAEGLVEIGSIFLSNSQPDLQFTPGIDIDLKVDITEDNRKLPEDSIHVGSESGANTYKLDNLIPHDKRCRKVVDKDVVVLPLYIDMRKLNNPLVARETLRVNVIWSYNHHYNPAEFISGENAIGEIDFLQDSQGAELIVSSLSEEGEPMRIRNGQSIRMKELEFNAEGNTVVDLKFRLGNLATDMSRAGAGVKISGMTVTESIDGVTIRDRKGQWLEELFVKSDSAISELSLSSGHILRNGKDSFKDFILTFDPGKVMTVTGRDDFRFESIVTVEFDYVENSLGEDYTTLTPEHFKFEIRQPLYLKPNPNWLCIDYGSSAIVCKYENNVLNLHTRKNNILKRALGNTAKSKPLLKDTFEENTEFLSSDIILHIPINMEANKDVSSLCSEQPLNQSDAGYDKLSVMLSPTSSMIVNEVLRQLPCLKLLVGNELLPPNAHYQGYEYDIANPNGGVVRVKAEEILETNPEKSLVVIDNVFRESYEALLRYFIIPEVKDVNLINRLVLTYPNTYTPRHLYTLGEIVKKVLPGVRELEFVSESDAVAAYYLENWANYHEPGANPNVNETVLVFDMGAGTLDLSLIRKTTDSEGRITMEIMAKIGTCKAGNYLDFVLAEIVCDLIGEHSKGGMALASTHIAASADIGRERSRLKDFVKNTLKPQIKSANRDKELTFESKNGEIYKSFTIGQVMDDSRLKKFLHEATIEIVMQLASFAGGNCPMIDTVLMSGRSSLFAPLRSELEKAVKKFNGNAGTTTFVRLDDPLNGKKDISRQKTAVSEGAMDIMVRNYRGENSKRRIISKRVYASFGVAYQDLGRWHYVELLDYRKIPAGITGEYNGERVKLPNLNNIPSLIVIQSYLDAESTEKALNDDRWDYLAEIERISLDGQSEESLMMKINKDNNIILYLGQQRTRGRSPKGDDLSGAAIKRSLWPVTL